MIFDVRGMNKRKAQAGGCYEKEFPEGDPILASGGSLYPLGAFLVLCRKGEKYFSLLRNQI